MSSDLANKKGLCFECTGCGECCTNRGEYSYVYLNDEETRTLAEFLQISLREFKRLYTFVDEDGWRQLSFTSDHCIFLDPESKRCRVYSARPIQCRTFPFWRHLVVDGAWTDQARALCEGVGRGPIIPEEEAEARMFEMEQSDED